MSWIFSFRYHEFSVPLDWTKPDSNEKTTIIVREILEDDNNRKPPLLYFQGGPGFGVRFPTDEKWIQHLKTKFRVFLMDQRGTGLSSPIDLSQVVARDSADRNKTIEFLTHFRADSIARDAEYIRTCLFKDEQFHTFGQSFGGWCTYAYLSLFPESPAACLLTGGFPPVGRHPKDVYRALIPQIDRTNKNFLDTYPETKNQLEFLMNNLDEDSLFLLARFGFNAGYSPGHVDLRSMIETLFFEIKTLGEPRASSINKLVDPLGFRSNPLYCLLHEPIYCEGIASNWAGETVMLEEFSRPSLTNPEQFFLAENIFRNEFLKVEELKPLQDLMDALMSFEDWGQLYDLEKLKSCEVPVIGVVYENDAAVATNFAKESAALLGNSTVISSNLDHSAYRSSSDEIFSSIFNEYDNIFIG